MKTKLIPYFSFVLFLVFVAACKKGGPFDYRRKYTGNFRFTIKVSPPPFTPSDTSYFFTYDGHIDLIKNTRKMRINYASDLTIEPEMNKNKELTYKSLSNFNGAFDDENSLHFTYNSGHTVYAVKGERN